MARSPEANLTVVVRMTHDMGGLSSHLAPLTHGMAIRNLHAVILSCCRPVVLLLAFSLSAREGSLVSRALLHVLKVEGMQPPSVQASRAYAVRYRGPDQTPRATAT